MSGSRDKNLGPGTYRVNHTSVSPRTKLGYITAPEGLSSQSKKIMFSEGLGPGEYTKSESLVKRRTMLGHINPKHSEIVIDSSLGPGTYNTEIGISRTKSRSKLGHIDPKHSKGRVEIGLGPGHYETRETSVKKRTIYGYIDPKHSEQGLKK